MLYLLGVIWRDICVKEYKEGRWFLFNVVMVLGGK